MREEYLSRMEHIAFMGGKIALELISSSNHCFKPDKSVLTKADVGISKLSHSVISDLLKTSDHILIDLGVDRITTDRTDLLIQLKENVS